MKKEKEKKRSRKDRSDGYFIAEKDALHTFMPYILPNRADNEAVMSETIDMTQVDRYVTEKNASCPEFKYTAFHVIVAALAKTIYQRPKMNYFYIGHRLYQRKDISFSFVVKKQFEDSSEESLAIIKANEENKSPVEQIHDKVKDIVYKVRKEGQNDDTTDIIGKLGKLPRFMLRFFMRTINSLDYHGNLPGGLLNFDPYHSTVFVANLGSIKLSAQYHHLTNWGTNSFFVIVGEKKKRPFFNDDGTFDMKDSIEFGLTIDERIADGVYFSKTIKMFRYFMENPWLLDKPLNEKAECGLELTNKPQNQTGCTA